MTRWDDLFDDLQAQATALSAAVQDAEIAERSRIETAQLSLFDRLGPAVDTRIRVSCQGVEPLVGVLRQLGAQWLLIEESGGREAIVVASAVVSVTGVSRLSSAPGSAGALAYRLGLPYVLRGVARDRSPVQLHLLNGATIGGTIDRVGADFVEVAEHLAGEQRRGANVRQSCLVAMSQLGLIRRDG